MSPSRPVKPLHEKVRAWGRVRRWLRAAFFRFLGKLAATDEARVLAVTALRDLLPPRCHGLSRDLIQAPLPYPGLAQRYPPGGASRRGDVILITARFRTGSTLLWNLFRHIDGVTAYYEPLNERRWFDAQTRGQHIDPTHRKAEDYWREYEGLTMLGRYYREAWVHRNLYMAADAWDPDMERYVELLIDCAPGRPVLQFNRIDFRLPWFRRHFPQAKIVHLFRHPREQWCSSLLDPTRFPRNGTLSTFVDHDHFYLRNWARDLKYHFPFLDETAVGHPYTLFYFLWKLSYLFGRRHADQCMAFENLIDQPEACMANLFANLQVHNADLAKLKTLITTPAADRWKEYAPPEWFEEQEAFCETVIADFFAAS
jgi:hypothetical protein